MNTTQIISAAPQAGTAKTIAVGSAAKLSGTQAADAPDNKGTGSFDSALEKSQAQGADNQTMNAPSAKNVKDAKGTKDAKAEKSAKTVKDQTDASGQEVSAGEGAEKAAQAVGQAAFLAAGEAPLAVALQGDDAPEEAAAQLLTETDAPAASLQTLLPQDAAGSAQQTKLLAMLAGQSISPEKAQGTGGESLVPAQKTVADKAMSPGGAPAATAQQMVGGNTVAQTPLADAFGQLQTWSGATHAQASDNTAIQRMTVQSLAAQAVATQASTDNAQVQERTVQVSDFANLFGTKVDVDGAQPVLLAAHTAQNGGSALFQQGQQAFSRSFGQEGAAQQLPESAAADKTAQAADAPPAGTSAQGLMSFTQTLARTDHASAAAPQAMPRTDYDVPKQIVDQARLIQRGQDTEMVIHLKPEHLGDMTLRVSVGTDGAVSASFHSNNAEVRTIIENTLVQLRQELNNQGLKVDNVGVYAGLADGGLPQDQGQQQAFQQGSQQQRSTRESAAAFEDGQELASALAAQGGSTATDGVDYRI